MSMFNPPSVPSPSTGIGTGAMVANAQQNMNTTAAQDSQHGSMVNQYNPYGSLTYNQTGASPDGTPLYSSSLQLTPQQQQMFDTLQGTKSMAGAQGGKLLSDANYGNGNPADIIGDSTKGNTAAYMQAQTAYLDPFFTTQRDQLDTKLKNQGLAPGMPGYDNALRSYETNRNLSVGKLASDFEPQAYQQATANYLLPGQLAENLANFGAPGDPKAELTNAPGLSVQPANLTGAITGQQSNAMDAYKAQQAQYSAMMNGLFGVGSAAAGGWGKAGFPGMGSLLGTSSLGTGAAGAGAADTGAMAGAAGVGDMAALLAI